MKSAILWLVVVVALVISVDILYRSKYDEWFVYPAKRAFINNNLKDPSSTQYRNQHMTESGWLCGELNSKNSSGGYVGFKRFIAGPEDSAYLEGHGYIGKGIANKSTKDVIQDTDDLIEILKQINESQKLGGQGVKLSEFERKEVITQELFEKKWQRICGS